MAATGTFQDVLHVIETSNLNYKIELSPFSAIIYLKNSFIKDKNGNNVISRHMNDKNYGHVKSENDELARKIVQQENVIRTLQANYENTVEDSEQIYKTNNMLEKTVQFLHSKLALAVVEVKDVKVLAKDEENVTTVADKLEKLMQEASDLAARNEKLNIVVKTLNRKLNESKEKAKSELSDVKKEFKAEIKSWRKELGDERKTNIKLDRKLNELTNKTEVDENSDATLAFTALSSTGSMSFLKPNLCTTPQEVEVFCTICAELISDYVPKYFLGSELNPACYNCQDSSISPEAEQTYETDEPFT
jgi:myosin heavy subunit